MDLTLRLLVSAAPIALILVGLLIFRSYPIDEERRQGNRKLLQELRYGNGPGLTSPSRLYT